MSTLGVLVSTMTYFQKPEELAYTPEIVVDKIL